MSKPKMSLVNRETWPDEAVKSAKPIRTRKARLQFLAEVIEGEYGATLRERIEAVKLVAQICGDIVKKHVVSGDQANPVQINVNHRDIDDRIRLLVPPGSILS